MYEVYIRIHTVDVSHEANEDTYHKNCLKQILPTIFSTRNTYIWIKNYFIHCSLMTVVNVHVKKLSNRTKLGSN